MSVTLSRLLPDAAELVHEILATSGATVSSDVPANLASKCPWFVAYRFGGVAPHQQFLDRATIQVSAYDVTTVGARDLAETGRVLLYQAWRSQYSTAKGTVHQFAEVSAPTELRVANQPDGIWRYDATYSIWVRPATVS